MRLNKDQLIILRDALLAGFGEKWELEELTSFYLGIDLNKVALGDSLKEIVFKLITWANTNDKIPELIDGALRQSQNPLVQDLPKLLQPEVGEQHSLSLQEVLQLLGTTNRELFGREEEMSWLNECYNDPQLGIVVLTAIGGIGKSALISKWLTKRFSPRSADKVRFVACSFFSQGTSERPGTSEQFLYDALKLLGDPEPTKGTPAIRGERLAKYVGTERTVLILDGLEPLQFGPGPEGREGQVKDIGIRNLLQTLADNHGQAFCIVTSRLEIREPFSSKPSFIQRALEPPPRAEAEKILRNSGLKGTDDEFNQAVDHFDCHPLALVLAAEYLNTYEDGRVGSFYNIKLIDEGIRAGRHARSVMAAYEAAIARDGDLLDIEFLKVLGLFNRPTEWSWIEALYSRPIISGFKRFGVADIEELRKSLYRLRSWKFLIDTGTYEKVDTHALIREYFGGKFQTENPIGWKEANSKLFNHFSSSEPNLPQTPEQITPLLLAVMHGCRAGRYADTLKDVFIARIMRGEEAYAVNQLGLMGQILSAMVYFFQDKNWLKPIVASTENPDGLDPRGQAYLLIQVGYLITALEGYAASRLEEIYNLADHVSLQIKDQKMQFQAKYGLWRYYSAKGNLRQSLQEAHKLLELARELNSDEHLLAAYRALTTSLYRRSEFTEARDYAEKGINLKIGEDRTPRLLAYLNDDPGINGQCFAASSLWHLGYAKQAKELQEQALARSRRAACPHAHAVALYVGSYIYDFCREYGNALKVGREMIVLSREYGFKWWLAAGTIRYGWAFAMLRDVDEGLSNMTEGLKMWLSAGSRIGLPYWKSLLAEVYLKKGDCSKALDVLDEAIVELNKTDERWWEPELYRLKGEAMLKMAASEDEAQDQFLKSLALSKERQGRALELRAATSLSKYWYRIGKQNEALKQLQCALDSLPDRSETEDEICAERLLQSLQS